MAKGKYQAWLEPEALERVANWAANGLTNEQIAKSMGVHRSTLRDWAGRHPAISDAIKRGRMLSCEAVENALFTKATGRATSTEVTVQTHVELVDGERVEVEDFRREVTKTPAPDTAAAIFYLKNRMPERYSDRRTVEVEPTAPTVVLGIEPGRADG